MLGGIDILGALSQPLRALVDPQERIFWLFLLSSLAMPWLVLGLRRGTLALRHGLLRREIWTSASSRTDLTFVFVKALVGVVLRIPWLAATAGATLWVALTLDAWLGPASDPASTLGWGRPTIAIVYSLVLFVGWDLSRFALHLAMHRVRVLWAFHQVHHSARTLTPLTLYRTHPVETLLYDLRGLLTTAAITGVFLYLFSGTAQAIELLGINALGFAFNLAGANLRHSHVWLRFGRVERWLLSPAQHQMHHASERALERSNLGTWLALWDRLAGTWRAAPEQAPDEYGLRAANHRYDRVGSMLIGPLLDVLAGRRTKATALTALVGLWMLPATAQARSQPESVDTPTSAAPDPDEPEPEPEPSTEPTSEPEPEPSTEPTSEPEPGPPTDAEPESPPTDAEPEPLAEPEPPPPAQPSPQSDPVDAPAETPAEPEPSQPPDPAELEDPSLDDEEQARTVRVGSMFAEDGVARVAGSAHVIDEKELERHEYDDVHKVLTTVPGVYVRQEDGFGLRPNIGFRGANSERSAKIVLLEDGVLLGPAPYSAPAAYFFPLPTRMVGLEVFKGPASVQHGPNTIGGAINLLTRQIPQTHMSEVDLAVGRFGYGKGHAFYGTTYKGFGVLVEAARVQTTGFKELDTGGDTGFAKNDAMLKLGYSTPAGQRIRHQVELKAGIASEDSDETYLGLSRADFDATPYRRYAASDRDNMSWWRTQAELTYLLRQEELIEIEARVYRHDFERTWSRLGAFQDLTGRFSLSDILAAEPGAGQIALYSAILRGDEDTLPGQSLRLANNGRRYVSQGIQTAFRWMPQWGIVKQRLEIGARLHGDSIERNHTEDAFLMTSGQMVPDGSDRSTTTLNRGEALAAAFHVHDAVTLWDRLTLAPGVRLELISTGFEDELADPALERPGRGFSLALSPGVGAFVQATRWLGVFGGVHRGFSPVAPGQPSTVDAEVATNYELGTRAVYEGLWAEAVGFFSDYDNMLGNCTFSAGCIDGDGSQQFNAGRVFTYGVETLARYRHRFDSGFGFEVGGQYTYTGSSFREPFTSPNPQLGEVERGDELPYVPKHIAGGSVGVGGRIWNVNVSPSYTSLMRDVAGQGTVPDGEQIPGFFVLDVGAEVRVLQRFRIYSQVGNVTNNAYAASLRPFGLRPGAPLTFMVGVKASIFP